jgi:putative Ca2+/H+ antiporter (TMEM165/GDT1 family)
VDALVTTFVAAALAEVGDKTQLLVVALGARYRKAGAVLLGVALAALLNSLLAAAGGTIVNGMITLRAISLLVAVALVFAAGAGFMPQTDEKDMGSSWKTGAFVTSATCFFLLEFADKTQFLTFALAAQFNSLGLAAVGATAGVIAANAPAALLGYKLPELIPLARVRLIVAILFLLLGFVVAVNALRLV